MLLLIAPHFSADTVAVLFYAADHTWHSTGLLDVVQLPGKHAYFLQGMCQLVCVQT